MTRTKSLIHSAEVREVRECFQRWRSNKKQGREPIPSKLWGMAAELCKTCSINRVARHLGLNHAALKAEVNRCLRGRHPKQAFVELTRDQVSTGIISGSSSARATTALAPTQVPGVEYVVEAPVHKDGTPRIHVRGASVSEVAALVRALRDNGEAA
jgi:hypothetical protein